MVVHAHRGRRMGRGARLVVHAHRGRRKGQGARLVVHAQRKEKGAGGEGWDIHPCILLTVSVAEDVGQLHKLAARTARQLDDVRQRSQQAGDVRKAVQRWFQLHHKVLLVDLTEHVQGHAAHFLQHDTQVTPKNLQGCQSNQRGAIITLCGNLRQRTESWMICLETQVLSKKK